MNAHQIVEAVLFASDAPLTAEEIARADESLDEDRVEEALRFLQAEYDDAERSFQVVTLAEGYQILTRPEFAPYLERFDNVPRPSRLSGPALETLAIIAYRQPIGRIEIEYIRGVGCAGVLKTLTDRELVDVVGRAEGLGRPVLYGTTRRFLEHFAFRSLEDLPRPEELPVVLRERIPLGPEPGPEEEEETEAGSPAGEAATGDAPTGVAEEAAGEGGPWTREEGEAEPDAVAPAEEGEPSHVLPPASDGNPDPR
ncbi:MAG TPA: SMC-Scp complex subunit ScpB [Longimicrobiales bacterium]|nr:SMC-Scp complex subunit ScpB [Longimicrobiales bacterium]